MCVCVVGGGGGHQCILSQGTPLDLVAVNISGSRRGQ